MSPQQSFKFAASAAAAVGAAVLLAGCSSGSLSKTASAPSTSAATHTASTPAASPVAKVAVDPNTKVCDKVHTLMVDRVVTTFHGWDTATNEFSPKVGRALRAEATDLFGLERGASGPAAAAIRAEASGLVAISLAVESQDDAALTSAATRTDGALAQLRGACNF